MGRKVQVNMTDGDYLRLLDRTLYEFKWSFKMLEESKLGAAYLC